MSRLIEPEQAAVRIRLQIGYTCSLMVFMSKRLVSWTSGPAAASSQSPRLPVMQATMPSASSKPCHAVVISTSCRHPAWHGTSCANHACAHVDKIQRAANASTAFTKLRLLHISAPKTLFICWLCNPKPRTGQARRITAMQPDGICSSIANADLELMQGRRRYNLQLVFSEPIPMNGIGLGRSMEERTNDASDAMLVMLSLRRSRQMVMVFVESPRAMRSFPSVQAAEISATGLSVTCSMKTHT